jgi:hypothetical protein
MVEIAVTGVTAAVVLAVARGVMTAVVVVVGRMMRVPVVGRMMRIILGRPVAIR